MSKAVRNLEVVRRAGKLFDCPRVLKSCFNAYALFILEHCVPVWMSSAESHLGWLDSIVHSEKRLVKASFVVRDTEERAVPCLCYVRFITEWTIR